MNLNKLSKLSIIMLGLSCSYAATAETFSLGASALINTSAYKGVDTRYYPIPIVNYEDENFYFRSLMAGYYLWNDRQNKLSLTAGYQPFNFKPSKSDDSSIKLLNKRRGTAMAGLSYSHHEVWGDIRTTLLGDVLDNSNGIVGDAAYLYAFKQDNWVLVPGVGVTWNSANENKYYYGINSSESQRSGLDTYKPNSSVNPYLELTAQYHFNKDWQAFLTGRYIRLASEIKDSPMVDKNHTTVMWTGVLYTF